MVEELLPEERWTKSLGEEMSALMFVFAPRRECPEILRLRPKLATRLTEASFTPALGSDVRLFRLSAPTKLSSSSRPCGVEQNESMVVGRRDTGFLETVNI